MSLRRIPISLLLLVSMVAAGCGATGRHLAVQADYAFARAVFAVDDAEFAMCQAGTLAAQQCDALNPYIKSALQDVKAVSLALRELPVDAKAPTSLPDLLQNLTSIQKVLVPVLAALPPAVQAKVQPLLDRVTAALDEAIALVRLFSGVRS